MPHAHAVFAVDEQLLWIVRLPTAPVGAALPASPPALAFFVAKLAALERDAAGTPVAGLAGAVTEAVLRSLEELPELPLIGEPFGGEAGTD